MRPLPLSALPPPRVLTSSPPSPSARPSTAQTYHEAMAWLEAQRRMSMGDEMRGLLQPE